MNPNDSSRDPAIMSPDEEIESRYIELLLKKDISKRGQLTVIKEEEHVVKAKTPIQ